MKISTLEKIINNISMKFLESAVDAYSSMYSRHPLITNYLSCAVGTIGGDMIAKQFTSKPEIKLRDIAFTASAAVVYGYLGPKMIKWSTKLTDRASHYWNSLKESDLKHTLFNSTLMTMMYFPVNMLYWNYLTIKNQAPLTLEDNIAGAITLGIATIPYLVADYVAIKKFSQPNTLKWLMPFYSGVGIVWNTLFAGGNYLVGRM